MNRILAIDPGNTDSGWVVIDAQTRRPMRFGLDDNHKLMRLICCGGFDDCDTAVIEMIASYGMPVGKEVFDTCVWIGRFKQAMRLIPAAPPEPPLIYRQPVKLHHCHTSTAKDPNITQALVDRFAPGQPNKGKGTKTNPGWFHGFARDIWQAYALAVYAADQADPAPF